jgi:hypothetical protein
MSDARRTADLAYSKNIPGTSTSVFREPQRGHIGSRLDFMAPPHLEHN